MLHIKYIHVFSLSRYNFKEIHIYMETLSSVADCMYGGHFTACPNMHCDDTPATVKRIPDYIIDKHVYRLWFS